jgi:hypothetical protein
VPHSFTRDAASYVAVESAHCRPGLPLVMCEFGTEVESRLVTSGNECDHAHGSAVLEKDMVVIADATAQLAGVRLGMKRGGMANTCWTLLTVSSGPRLNSTTGSGCRRPSSTLPQPQRG